MLACLKIYDTMFHGVSELHLAKDGGVIHSQDKKRKNGD